MPSKILGQQRPPTLNTFVDIYTVPADTEVTGMVMTIANVSGVDSTFQITQDDAGTGDAAQFALAWDVAIAADGVVKLNIGPMNVASGTIAVSSDLGNANVFTLHGTERLIA